jgi:hypothetical protein
MSYSTLTNFIDEIETKWNTDANNAGFRLYQHTTINNIVKQICEEFESKTHNLPCRTTFELLHYVMPLHQLSTSGDSERILQSAKVLLSIMNITMSFNNYRNNATQDNSQNNNENNDQDNNPS